MGVYAFLTACFIMVQGFCIIMKLTSWNKLLIKLYRYCYEMAPKSAGWEEVTHDIQQVLCMGMVLEEILHGKFYLLLQ